MKKAYIALGSNLGDRLLNLKNALEYLNDRVQVKVETLSPVYETAPVGGPKQGAYLNACTFLQSALSPTKLLLRLLEIETKMGRSRNEHWGPRIIDLDLLIYENIIMNTPLLELPHPHIGERDFVLVPLNDIAPQLVIPGINKPVEAILAGRKPSGGVILYTSSLQI